MELRRVQVESYLLKIGYHITIEPIWNWDQVQTSLFLPDRVSHYNRTNMELRLIGDPVFTFSANTSHYNRTNMELRPENLSLEKPRFVDITIEPIWNWDFSANTNRPPLDGNYNRTNMELRHAPVLSENLGLEKPLQSNQYGIETTPLLPKLSFLCLLLQSNQYGIET